MRRILIVLLTACLVSLSAAPPRAADQTAPANEENGLQMSLADCLRRALENNLDLVIARKDPLIAEQGVETQQAPFDPNLGASASYQKQSTGQTITNTDLTLDPPETVSQDVTSDYTLEQLGASWAQRLKFGADYSAEFDFADMPQSTGARVLGPGFLSIYDSSSRNPSLTLTFNMPLLRGFGKEVNTLNLVLAKSNVDISRQGLLLQSQLTIQEVENAYWDLVAARAALQVARESMKLAQDLYDLNRKKVEVGTLAPIEITQAEAGVASREEAVIIAETAVLNAQDNLLRLMAVPKEDPAWSQRILPTDRPEYQVRDGRYRRRSRQGLRPPPGDRDRQAAAQEQRAVGKGREARDEALAEPHRRPRPRVLGLEQHGGPGHFRRLRDAAVQHRPRNDTRAWSVGLLYGFPIGNRAAKANYEVATLTREKAEVGLQNTEQSIRVDVRAAARSVESGVKRVEAARANTVLQRKTVEAEQKKFENGMSTSFEVLRIQNDLFSAQLAEIQAILSYTKSLVDLERAQGTILEARGLSLDSSAGR